MKVFTSGSLEMTSARKLGGHPAVPLPGAGKVAGRRSGRTFLFGRSRRPAYARGMDAKTAPTCRLLRPGESYAGKQGFTYTAGISSETAGARGICMHLLTIQPGD